MIKPWCTISDVHSRSQQAETTSFNRFSNRSNYSSSSQHGMAGLITANVSFSITPFTLRASVWKTARHANDSFRTPTMLHEFFA